MFIQNSMIRYNTTDGGGTGGQASGDVGGGQASGQGTALTGDGQGAQGGQVNTGGSAIPDWAVSLPDELKSSPSLANYKDLPSFVKSSLEAEKMLGRKGIVKPGEGATPEELTKFYNDLGRPEKAEGYQLKRPEKWPEHLEFSDALVPKVQEMFHKRGVPADMAKGIFEDYHELIASEGSVSGEAAKVEMENGLKALKQEWGGDEKYAAHLETAKMAVKEFGGDSLIDFLNESGLGDHPAMIKAFANAGKQLREDGFVSSGNHSGAMTLEKAKGEIDRLNNDKAFTDVLYSNKFEDRQLQQEAKKKIESLYQIAYPTFTK